MCFLKFLMGIFYKAAPTIPIEFVISKTSYELGQYEDGKSVLQDTFKSTQFTERQNDGSIERK